MDFQFHHTIPEEEKNDYVSFYNTCGNNAIEQHPLWMGHMDPSGAVCHFGMRKNGTLVCTAVIEENKKLSIRSANIRFGPLFTDRDLLIESIDQICDHYKKQRYGFLTIQLGIETGADADYIEYRINRLRRPRYFFDRENWSSIIIDLKVHEEQLVRNFSKGHKSDVKKAQKLGLTVTENGTAEQFDAFISVYRKMHHSRGLKEPMGNSELYLQKIKEFFQDQQAGKFLLVADAEGKILGGIAVAFQNKTFRYFKGAADPDSRSYPVLHLAIAHAIKDAKASGYEYFDLWGYNHFVDENDQVFHINKFKKGFGGDYIFYPKRMYFVFSGLKFNFLSAAEKIYKKYFTKK